MRPHFALGCAMLCLWFTPVAIAQDAVKVDPAHYKVETENAQVRVLRVHYGAHEKSVMHSHPAAVAVFLSDGTVRFTDAKGKTQDTLSRQGRRCTPRLKLTILRIRVVRLLTSLSSS